MLVTFEVTLKHHLNILNSYDEAVLKEFFRIALTYLSKGGSVPDKLYSSAASKLEVEATLIKNAVEAISFVLITFASHKLEPNDMIDSLLTAGLQHSVSETFQKFYVKNSEFLISSILEAAAANEPAGHLFKYEDLEWRVQVEIGSRALRGQCVPKILCKLKTVSRLREAKSSDVNDLSNIKDSHYQSHLFEMDPRDLIHITQTLEEALLASKTSRYRRILRSMVN